MAAADARGRGVAPSNILPGPGFVMAAEAMMMMPLMMMMMMMMMLMLMTQFLAIALHPSMN